MAFGRGYSQNQLLVEKRGRKLESVERKVEL